MSDTEKVYLNGLLQEPGSGKDYTISGDTITFSLAPNTGDVLLVSYLMGEALGGSSGGANVPYGYSMGGYYLSTIDRITFPFDSGTASHVGYLSSSKGYAPACNSSNYGYVMGGYNGSAHMSTIDRITFPFDSGTASHVGNLLNAKAAGTGCNSSIYGYCMLGDSGGYSSYEYMGNQSNRCQRDLIGLWHRQGKVWRPQGRLCDNSTSSRADRQSFMQQLFVVIQMDSSATGATSQLIVYRITFAFDDVR